MENREFLHQAFSVFAVFVLLCSWEGPDTVFLPPVRPLWIFLRVRSSPLFSAFPWCLDRTLLVTQLRPLCNFFKVRSSLCSRLLFLSGTAQLFACHFSLFALCYVSVPCWVTGGSEHTGMHHSSSDHVLPKRRAALVCAEHRRCMLVRPKAKLV